MKVYSFGCKIVYDSGELCRSSPYISLTEFRILRYDSQNLLLINSIDLP